MLYGTDGAPLTVSGASNPGGSNPGGQEASSAIDGEDGTKWCACALRARPAPPSLPRPPTHPLPDDPPLPDRSPRPPPPLFLPRHDDNFGASGGSSTLVVHLATKAVLGSYTLKTANDVPSRDPSAWSLYIVHGDGAPDTLLSSVDEVSLAPTERLAAYPTLFALLPPPPPHPPHAPSPPSPPPAPPMAPSGDVYRFTFTGVRGDGTDGIQLGEIALFDPEGAKLTVVEATNPGGERGVANQGPDKLVDGDATSGKWFDDSFTTVGSTNVDLRLASPAVVASYQLTTAGGNVRHAQVWAGSPPPPSHSPPPRRHSSPSPHPLPSPPPQRDPTDWKFGILRPGGAFHLLSEVAAFDPPADAFATYHGAGGFRGTNPPPTPPPSASPSRRRRRARRRRSRPAR